MNVSETRMILSKIQTAYPNWHIQDKALTLETWSECLVDYPFERAAAALMAYISTDTSGFAPSIGQIINLMRTSEDGDDMTPEEAWSLVDKAVGRSGYYSEEEFRKLPPLVQRAVGSPGNLREMAFSDIDAFQSVEKSHFIRIYSALLERERESRKIPKRYRTVLGLKAHECAMVEDKTEKAIETRRLDENLPSEQTMEALSRLREKLA